MLIYCNMIMNFFGNYSLTYNTLGIRALLAPLILSRYPFL